MALVCVVAALIRLVYHPVVFGMLFFHWTDWYWFLSLNSVLNLCKEIYDFLGFHLFEAAVVVFVVFRLGLKLLNLIFIFIKNVF